MFWLCVWQFSGTLGRRKREGSTTQDPNLPRISLHQFRPSGIRSTRQPSIFLAPVILLRGRSHLPWKLPASRVYCDRACVRKHSTQDPFEEVASVLGEDNAGGALDLCRLVQAMTRTHILSTLMGSSLIETRGGEATLAVLLQQMDIRSRQDPCTRSVHRLLHTPYRSEGPDSQWHAIGQQYAEAAGPGR